MLIHQAQIVISVFAAGCFQTCLSSSIQESSKSLKFVDRAAMTTVFIPAKTGMAYWVFLYFCLWCWAASLCTCVFARECEAQFVSHGKPGRGPGGLLDLTQVQIILETTAHISTLGGGGGASRGPAEGINQEAYRMKYHFYCISEPFWGDPHSTYPPVPIMR